MLSRAAGEPLSSVLESIYRALGLVFLQSSGDFPTTLYLQVFYFVMPILGLGILARGLTEFGVLLFNRRSRSKEWEMAVASTFGNHIVLVGLGHLGYRVVKHLHEMNQDVVVIELKASAETANNVRAMGIPILHDDGRRETVLEAAGIRKARSLVLCTQDDTQNLQIAVKARNLNPGIQVIVRIFDDDFAQALQKQFDFKALERHGHGGADLRRRGRGHGHHQADHGGRPVAQPGPHGRGGAVAAGRPERVRRGSGLPGECGVVAA